MLTEERRTIEEGYSTACNATDLTVKADARRPPDYLIASGMTRNMLGGALMRLHSEWTGMNRKGISETDARLIYGRLKTLRSVRDALAEWLAKRGVDSVTQTAEQIIAYWLDDVCHACQGRGYELIPGTPVTGRACKRCHGTGKRQPPAGQQGRAALNMMDECVQGHRTGMAKRLRAMR